MIIFRVVKSSQYILHRHGAGFSTANIPHCQPSHWLDAHITLTELSKYFLSMIQIKKMKTVSIHSCESTSRLLVLFTEREREREI